jgi:SPX domain protein involved in polyphosphate accumulation
VEEWREFYISYKKLKRVLKKAEINIKSPAPERTKQTGASSVSDLGLMF